VELEARARAASDAKSAEAALDRARVLNEGARQCLRGYAQLRPRSVRMAALLYGASIRAAARAIADDGQERSPGGTLAAFPAKAISRVLGSGTSLSTAAAWVSADRAEVNSWTPREARHQTRRLRRLAAICLSKAGERVEAIGRIVLFRICCCVALGAVLLGSLLYGWELWRRASDLLEGQPWRASSALLHCKPLDEGGCSPQRPDAFFHTQLQQSPWIEYDIGKPVTLHELRVENAPGCCTDRAVPLVVEVSEDRSGWREVRRRMGDFRVWHAYLPRVSARYLRLSVAKETYLHLNRVQAW
jgi:hypothetical protein